MLEINKLSVLVDSKLILEDINLKLARGEIVALMGPNGSGKSSLANVIMGHPKYVINKGKIVFSKTDITEESPDARARMGVHLTMQYTMSIPGLPAHTLLWRMYGLHVEDKEKMKLGDFRIWVSELANSIGLNHDLLRRSINDGFSGGEKKKLEVLQILCIKPKLIILDEIDSGLDVMALKTIGKTLASYVRKNKVSILVITHYSRFLKYLKPDRVVVLGKGKVVEEGDYRLVDKIEKNGY